MSSLRENCTIYTDFAPLPDTPKVSVILTYYKTEQISYFLNLFKSLSNQTYDNFEVLLLPESKQVINETKKYATSSNYLANLQYEIHPLQDTDGLSEARNRGAEYANGDIVAFLDIDTIPSEQWIEELVKPYQESDVFAVGGSASPEWEGRKHRPYGIPPEFDWLIGSTYTEFAHHGDMIRNTFGCNISYRTDVFLELGGFDSTLGKNSGYNLQGEEPQLGILLQNKYQTGVYYTQSATISHFVSEEQQTLKWLSNRAYLQGISKAIIEKSTGKQALNKENTYLKQVLLEYVPAYLKSGLTTPSSKQLMFAFLCLWYTFLVGIGYINGKYIQ